MNFYIYKINKTNSKQITISSPQQLTYNPILSNAPLGRSTILQHLQHLQQLYNTNNQYYILGLKYKPGDIDISIGGATSYPTDIRRTQIGQDHSFHLTPSILQNTLQRELNEEIGLRINNLSSTLTNFKLTQSKERVFQRDVIHRRLIYHGSININNLQRNEEKENPFSSNSNDEEGDLYVNPTSKQLIKILGRHKPKDSNYYRVESTAIIFGTLDNFTHILSGKTWKLEDKDNITDIVLLPIRIVLDTYNSYINGEEQKTKNNTQILDVMGYKNLKFKVEHMEQKNYSSPPEIRNIYLKTSKKTQHTETRRWRSTGGWRSKGGSREGNRGRGTSRGRGNRGRGNRRRRYNFRYSKKRSRRKSKRRSRKKSKRRSRRKSKRKSKRRSRRIYSISKYNYRKRKSKRKKKYPKKHSRRKYRR